MSYDPFQKGTLDDKDMIIHVNMYDACKTTSAQPTTNQMALYLKICYGIQLSPSVNLTQLSKIIISY